jgi:pimeloyl-ACP methyl ester carboxylesterase
VPEDPIKAAPGITCPVFFIHEQNDNLTTTQETAQLFAAAKNPAEELWEIPGALHSEGYKTYPVDYVDKVNAFFAAEFTEPVRGLFPPLSLALSRNTFAFQVKCGERT